MAGFVQHCRRRSSARPRHAVRGRAL